MQTRTTTTTRLRVMRHRLVPPRSQGLSNQQETSMGIVSTHTHRHRHTHTHTHIYTLFSFFAVRPYKEGVGVHGKKGEEPNKSWKLNDDFEVSTHTHRDTHTHTHTQPFYIHLFVLQGMMVGLKTKYETQALRNYLWANGKYTMAPVRLRQCFTMLGFFLRCLCYLLYDAGDG